MFHIRSLSLTLNTFLLLCITFSYAQPINHQIVLYADENNAKCDSIDTYTTEWFLANTLPDYRRELHNKALFYTRGTSRTARDLAGRSHGEYVTIWEIWPCWLYDDRQETDNRLSCIHRDHALRRTFYENMSRAFARMARASATVMHQSADYAMPSQDGIWARVELPTIQDMTDVELVSLLHLVRAVPD